MKGGDPVSCVIKFVGVSLVLAAGGCGAPMYPYSQPKLKVYKGAFGAGVEISTDAGLTLDDLEIDPSSGIVRLKHGSLDTKASPVLDKFLPLMDAYVRQQAGYNEIRKTEWAGFNQSLQTVASVAGPALGAYFQTRQMGIQASPQMTLQAALELGQTYLSGKANPAVINPILKAQAPELLAEVERVMPPAVEHHP